MSSPIPNRKGDPVDRDLSSHPNQKQVVGPVHFRSWEDQKAPSASAEPTKKAKAEPGTTPQRRRHPHAYSFWQSRDFRVMVALALTAIIAIGVYYWMKGQ